jgi:hypothetical protein
MEKKPELPSGSTGQADLMQNLLDHLKLLIKQID